MSSPGTPPPPRSYWVPPPPAPPRPSIDSSLIRPRRLWYWVAGAVFVAGAAVAVVLSVATFRSVTGDITQFSTPNEVTVDLEPGDRRTIYVQTLMDGSETVVGSSPPTSDELVCRVVGPTGPTEVSDITGSFTLTRGDDEYQALLRFEARSSGAHRVSCRERRPETEHGIPGEPLAIGPYVGVSGFIGSIFGIFASFLGGALLAILIAVLTAVLRHRHRRRLEHEASSMQT